MDYITNPNRELYSGEIHYSSHIKANHKLQLAHRITRAFVLLLFLLNNSFASAEDISVTSAKVYSSQDAYRAAREKFDKTIWSGEVLAQEHEQSLVKFWDELLAQDNNPEGDKFSVFSKVPFDELKIGANQSSKEMDWGIQKIQLGEENSKVLTPDDWQTFLGQIKSHGYEIVQSEWHHAAFEINDAGVAESIVSFEIHLNNHQLVKRVIVRGKLGIVWHKQRDEDNLPIPNKIDATNIVLLTQNGKPAFKKEFTFDPQAGLGKSTGVHPVMLYDLDGDGLSEILLGWCNQVFQNKGGWKFEREKLFIYPEEIQESGLIADLNGDTFPDCLFISQQGDVLIYYGDENGQFRSRAKGKTRSGGPILQASNMTCGDIDQDGDLDIWVSQYRISYLGGNMPEPFYNANDGFPSYLLLNQGRGKFLPRTEEAGLADKRNRRSYTNAFIDLDDDNDLDLLVVSDFAGIDVHLNDGTGKFHDVTKEFVDENHLFGMSATFGDYNLDGKLDFYSTGMSSTTARRLERMGAGHLDRPDMQAMRMLMAYGNRMYLRTENGYQAPAFADQVARTGWSWGAATLDFDNDGDSDIFVANGHQSGKSTKDHCTYFWCHDIYEGKSEPNPALEKLFNEVHGSYMKQDESWDGYQKNALLMNLEGEGMINIAFLLGVGEQFDGRAAVVDDLDGDGKVDLLVTEDDSPRKQVLHVYRNQMETKGNWIGVRLKPSDSKIAIGAKIRIKTSDRDYVGYVTVGESLYSQQAFTRHFGLGEIDKVSAVEVQWPSGKIDLLENPKVNSYHLFE